MSSPSSPLDRLGALASRLAGVDEAGRIEAVLGPACAAALGADEGRLLAAGDGAAVGAGELGLPLRVQGELRGIVALRWSSGRTLADDERALAAAAADVCALALERARLLRTTELARTRAVEAEARSAFLAEASVALGESLDYPTTLSRVARLIVPRVADWCTIGVLDPDDRLRRVAVVHRDPHKKPLADAYLEGYGPGDHRQDGMLPDLLAGRSVLRSVVTDEELQLIAHDPSHLELLRSLGVSSALIVPLLVRGRLFGAISMMQSDPSRRFTATDVPLGEDLARRAAIAIENARLYGEAQAANRSKDQFLAMLGHELRNPLAPIVTALEVMSLRGEEGSVKERAVIARQVQHLARLVDDLLDISRITRGKIELKRAPMEIARVIAKAVEMVTPLLEQRRHALELRVPAQGLVVELDEVRIAQVVANLLSNAAKYTSPGGRIQVIADREGPHVVVRVRDNGSGLAPELLPQVFDAFVQGTRAPDRALGGLGLGLTLVRSLVNLHGGSVSAASAGPGQGSEFVVRLPAAPVAAAATTTVERPQPAAAAAAARHDVLVVDDNADAADTLAEFLRDVGHRVEVAGDGPEALRLVARVRPSVAILDIGLPVMDGYELAELLRAQLGARCPYLIALTGYGQEQDRMRSRAAGFAVHLVKPVDLDELLGAIAAAPAPDGA